MLCWGNVLGWIRVFLFFKQKTAYEMRISDWSSDVCSSDLLGASQVVISAWGLREGLLYQQLNPHVQALDPLIEAARSEGDREGRFQGQGDDQPPCISPQLGRASCRQSECSFV